MTRTGPAPPAPPTPDVRRLFEELVELPWPARRARLERVDPSLARDVEDLLRAAESAPDFLERPAEESELLGHRAGPWLIEARLSGGGAGDVYRARRADTTGATGATGDWHVALKVLRKAASGADVRRRFEAERGSLAALNHPYIVPLIDAGTLADGRWYLATRLVDGEPLDRASAPLALEARLRLFLAVAGAVQHAHARLIAHCDLKPANILVTREGIPQIVDFGIARYLSGAHAAEAALTPGYASPEQLAGAPLDATSDVWSLGAVLYELASGKRPFRQCGRRARPRAAARARQRSRAGPHVPAASTPPPDAPARLARRLRGDFDALLARALTVDPAERYATVEALARDVEAFLGCRPLSARPATRPRRSWLWMRRNPAASLAAGVVLLALCAGGIALYRDAQRSRAEASIGWRAHAQAVLAARWIEDLARAAGAGPGLEQALDEARASLAREVDFPPEGEGRLRLTLGALYLQVDRPADALAELERARALTEVTRGFGGEDRERIERLCAEAAARLQAQD